MGIDTTQVTLINPATTSDIFSKILCPLGFIHLEPASKQMMKNAAGDISASGDQSWIYIYNEGDADLTPGDLAARSGNGAAVALSTATDAASAIVGVAQHTIPSQAAGFILRKGWGLVQFSSAGLKNNNIIPTRAGADGAADPQGILTDAGALEFWGDNIGHLTQDVGDDELLEAWLDCSG